jgi:hypothetical protein
MRPRRCRRICCNHGTCWVWKLTGSIRSRTRLKNNLSCGFREGSRHTLHETSVDLCLRGYIGAGCRECRIGANAAAGRLTIQSASTSTAATAQNRSARDPATGCAAAPDLSVGAAAFFRRPDQRLPGRSRRSRGPSEPPRGLFTRLRQSMKQPFSFCTGRETCAMNHAGSRRRK